jgi:uncharacterized protein DUF4255
MAATSSEAIGAVSDLLSARLSSALNNLPVPVGRPHLVGDQRALNLFLYNITLDPHLRNEPLDRGQPPPLWLVLHYLLTAFDIHGESDSVAALRLLGQGMAALHELNFVRPPVTNLWLAKNPEPLKITFEEAGADLLSKLMQGEEERFRVSAAVQVRPVMLGIETAPAYAPLVTSVGPPATPGVMVLPSMGARLLSMEPQRFVAGTAVTLTGLDLAGYDEVLLGANSLPASPGTVEGTVSFTVPNAAAISANAYPVCVARTLASGRKLKSNALLAELMPRVSGVALDGALTQLPPPGPNALRHGRFSVSGLQLGGADASALAGLYREGTAQGPFEADAGATTTQMLFTVPAGKALAPGDYQVIVRVNGQQASASPVLSWV